MIDVEHDKKAVREGALRDWAPQQIDSLVISLLDHLAKLSEIVDGYQVEYAALTEKAKKLAWEQDRRRRMH